MRRGILLPELVLIEDTRGFWQTRRVRVARTARLHCGARSRQNVAFRLGS